MAWTGFDQGGLNDPTAADFAEDPEIDNEAIGTVHSAKGWGVGREALFLQGAIAVFLPAARITI